MEFDETTQFTSHDVRIEQRKGKIFHFFLGEDVLDTTKGPETILCWKLTGEFPATLEGDNSIFVTKHKDHVNCQECIEWMGA